MPQETLSDILATVLPQFKTKDKQIKRAAIGFVKVACLCLSEEALKPHLPAVVEGVSPVFVVKSATRVRIAALTVHCADSKKAKNKIRGIFEVLVKRLGTEVRASWLLAWRLSCVVHMQTCEHRRSRI